MVPIRHLLKIPLCAATLAMASTAWSDAMIDSIRVEGINRIEADTVRSHVAVTPGQSVTPDALRKSIKALHDTGLFKDVAIEQQGAILVVRVVENPTISKITFEGNSTLSTEELQKLIHIKPNALFNRSATERDLTALRQAYRIKGFFLAKIDMTTKNLEQNLVDVVFNIEEGEKSRVQKVRIIGNKELAEKQLTRKMMIKPSGMFSWLTEDDAYDRDKLLFDQSHLRNVYLDEGYARVHVDSSVAELTPDRRAFVVTHSVTEGARYRFGAIDIKGDFTELPKEQLLHELRIRQGDWYSRDNLRKSIERLTDLIGDFGYAMLDIRPQAVYDDDAKTVAVTFDVNKGRRVYVNRIEVVGNSRTRDNVVRREMTLNEGDRFSTSQMRRSKKNIGDLNFFENVEITTPATGNPDQVDVRIKVEEKPTGTFTVGAGYSSTDSFIGSASVSQNNFLGRGQRMVLSTALTGTSSQFDFSFTEPYFLDKNLSAGVDLFVRESDRSRLSSYIERSYGGGVRLGFPINKNLRNNISYSLAEVDLETTGLVTSRALLAQAAESPYWRSMISNSLLWSDVNNNLFPTQGHSHRFTSDLAGLGGDISFLRLMSDNHFYYPFTDDEEWVGHLRGRFGAINGLSKDVPIFERFYLGGGSSLRGFKPGGIGPRTILEDDAFGGVHFEQVNAELFFPIMGMSDKGLRGVTFVDAGFLGDRDLPAGVTDSGTVRVATGVGVHWNSPFGPLRFSLSKPLLKEEFDKERTFDFSMGTSW
ncbi:MAG: outer membrane protein assembly factor BamA [Magnetococcales bacterium]|nr:outer membrane protein assembly factor BamA [Magnetococcales bacterium]NGZ06205.1 outer membrane protein assembly factor BamA [Magnetococcales bacterium]